MAMSMQGGDVEAKEEVELLSLAEEVVGAAASIAASPPALGLRLGGLLSSRSVLGAVCAGVGLIALRGWLAQPSAVHSAPGVARTGETVQLFGDLSMYAKEADGSPSKKREALRKLFDLDFRWDDDAEAAGQCTIDTVQSIAYLGQAVVFLYKAQNACPEPREADLPCGIAVSTVITSFAWIASYLSLAAHSCAQSLGAWPANEKMFCAADVTGLVADFGELATSSQAAAVDCDYSKTSTWAEVTQNNSLLNQYWDLVGSSKDAKSLEKKLQEHAKNLVLPKTLQDFLYPLGAHLIMTPYGPAKDVLGRRRLADEKSPLLGFLQSLKEKKAEADLKNKEQVARNFDIAQCVFDVLQSASYLVRATFQIHAAAGNCDDPRACTLDVFNIISSFAWLSQFTAYAVADCGVLDAVVEQNAYCAGDISDAVAASTNLVAIGMAFQNDCRDS